MNLKTLKKGLELNQNITDKGGNFEYYIAKVGHLKKNIAVGKYSIFTEAVGQYKEVATIGDDGEITFTNEDTKESQWFEGLARAIKDKFEDDEEEEEKNQIEETSQTSETKEELKTQDLSDDDFKKKLAKIKEEMAKAKQEAEISLSDKKIDEEIKKTTTTEASIKNKDLTQNEDLKNTKESEKKTKELPPNAELFKKYIKHGIKAGFPASKQFLFSISYVFFSNINLFQKLFLSTLLLSGSITMFLISLFFLPINMLGKANKKLTQAIKKSIKRNKEKDKTSQYIKYIFIRIPMTVLILSLYIPITFCLLLIILMFRTIGLSIVFISLLITTILILSFGYLFYEGEVANLFHEEFDLQKYKDLKRKKKEEKATKKTSKSKKSISKQKDLQTEDKEETKDVKEKELPSLNQEEQRQYNIIEAFITSEYELGINTEKAIQKKVDKIINTKESGSFITKEVLISINRKLIMENKEITNHKELRKCLTNEKILSFFL